MFIDNNENVLQGRIVFSHALLYFILIRLCLETKGECIVVNIGESDTGFQCELLDSVSDTVEKADWDTYGENRPFLSWLYSQNRIDWKKQQQIFTFPCMNKLGSLNGEGERWKGTEIIYFMQLLYQACLDQADRLPDKMTKRAMTHSHIHAKPGALFTNVD